MDWTVIRGHSLVLIATLAGIAGMGIVFGGAMHGDLHAMMRGAPFLLLGLWWAGHDLGRSMMASRARHARSPERSHAEDTALHQ
ncbi:MAG: hypothetical protein NVS2B16_11780 [Chloroflexota bacterium]